MKNLKSIITAGAFALAVAGCGEQTEHYQGKYANYSLDIVRFKDGTRTIFMTDEKPCVLYARDWLGVGVYSQKIVTGKGVAPDFIPDKRKCSSKEQTSLWNYANSDSLNVAYKEVMIQNGRTQ